MKSGRDAKRDKGTQKTVPIRTTLMELLQELSKLATDDALVVAAVKGIFATHRVRLARSLVPVRLVSADFPTRVAVKTSLGRKNSAWA
jgi:hypothetical protein